jgi:hypothetical protein
MSETPRIENRSRFSIILGRVGAVFSGKKRLGGLDLLAREVSARIFLGMINRQELLRLPDHEEIRRYLIQRGLLDEKDRVPLKILDFPHGRTDAWFISETPKLDGKLAYNLYENIYSKAFEPSVAELVFDFQRGYAANGEIRIPESICQAMREAKISFMTLKTKHVTPQRLNESLKYALRFLALGEFPKEGIATIDFPLISRGETGGRGGWGSGIVIKRTESGSYKVFVYGIFSHGAYKPDPIKYLLEDRPQDFK